MSRIYHRHEWHRTDDPHTYSDGWENIVFRCGKRVREGMTMPESSTKGIEKYYDTWPPPDCVDCGTDALQLSLAL